MFTINFVFASKTLAQLLFCKQFSLSKQKGFFADFSIQNSFLDFRNPLSPLFPNTTDLNPSRLILKLSYLKWKENIKKMYDELWKSTLDLVPDWQLRFSKIEEKTLHFYAPFDASLKEQVCSKRNKTRPSVQINDYWVKGQLISKANCQAVNSSKNEFVFTSMRRVFVCFLEEIEDSKKAFRNYLTFKRNPKIFVSYLNWRFFEKYFSLIFVY